MTRFGLAGNHLPTGWQTTSARHLFRREKRTGFPDEQLLSVYRDYGVIRKDSRDDNFNKASEDLASYQLVEPNDLVINKMKAWQGSVGISEHRGIVSPAYFVAKPTTNFFRRYVHYLLRCSDYLIEYQTRSSGIRVNQWDLDWDDFRDIPIALPPLAQQTRIANFLDEQTARIDALIAEKERLDALLGEYRGSLISAAVTGQLDPTTGEAVRRAHGGSGGVKPASWRKLSLKRVAEIMPSNVDKHSIEGELPVRLCNYVDVYNNDRIDDSIDFMVATASEAQIARFTLKAQDVLVTKDSEEPSDIGIPAFVPQDMPGIVCGYHLAVIRPDLMRVHGAFLHWALQSTEVQAYYETAAQGISRYALGINDLGMTPLHLPDRAEQTRIANFLDERTAQIDDLRSHCREHIALLREYRSSLISAAVTGQLDIDNFGREVA